eukprot:gene10665-13063_t
MEQKFDKESVSTFSRISGDHNPIHTDGEYAATTRFKRTIVHGTLVSSVLSKVVANRLPGPGSIYVKQELNYIKPTFVGDTVRGKVTVTGISGKKVFLDTECIAICPNTGVETTVITGPAIIYHPNMSDTSSSSSSSSN